MKHIHHIHIFILIGFLVSALMLVWVANVLDKINLSNPTTFGVSFAPRYTKELGLDPKTTYQNILVNLEVKHIRLAAYWDEIEPFDSLSLTQGRPFDFSELDWYINQASQHNAQVILVIGYKLPRWPECRAPSWLDSMFLRQRQLEMLKAVINHYEDNPTISAWQLENEPLLRFGDCPKVDREFLSKEVAFVKERTQKPIIITDSGELRLWRTPMQLSDIFGTTLYRVVETPWIGTFHYPLRPWFYRVKSDLVRKFFAPNNQKTIVSELQAETWANESLTQVPIDTQLQRFSLDQFKETVEFAKKTGFSPVYLWGAEWWYYLANHGHPEYLNFAKTLF